jgi:ankyrin repeat protein
MLIHAGADVQARDGVLLQNAAYKGHVSVVALLLEHKADVSVDNHLALRNAVQCDHCDVTELLLKHGAQIGAIKNLGILVSGGTADMVKLFIDYGLDVKSPQGAELVRSAASDGNTAVVNFLRTQGLEVQDFNPFYGLVSAASTGNMEKVKYIFENSSNFDTETLQLVRTSMLYVAKDGNVDLLKLFLEESNGSEFDKTSRSPLHDVSLYQAASAGHCEALEILLKHFTSPQDLYIALYAACKEGKVDAVRMILDHGACPSEHESDPLYVAAQEGHLEVVKLLLDRGVVINVPNPQSLRGRIGAMRAAIDGEHWEIAKLLMDHGADVVRTLKYLHMANRSGDPEVLEAMIRKLACTDVHGAAKYAAAHTRRYSLTKECLEQGADVGDYFKEFGSVNSDMAPGYQMLELLLSYGADPTICNGSALHLAVAAGDCASVELLMAHGVDPNAMQGQFSWTVTATERACSLGNLDVIKCLIAHGGGFTHDRCMAFKEAHEHMVDVVKLLIELGADASAGDSGALQNCGAHGSVEVARLLVEHKADVTADNNYPVQNACSNGHVDLVKYLVSVGADVHAENGRALNVAAWAGSLDVMRYLLDEQDPDQVMNIDVALQHAAQSGKLEVVKFLHETGADITADNNKAAGLARQLQNYEVESYLTSHGAVVPANANDLFLAPW